MENWFQISSKSKGKNMPAVLKTSNPTIFEGFTPLKPCWNKVVISGENAKTCLTLISGQKWKSETGFTSNSVNPNLTPGC